MTNREVADYNVLQSKVINELKFILIVLVVLIHCTVSECKTQGMTVIVERNTFPVYWLTMEFLSNIFARLAVPLFFFISGYLFFLKTNKFSLKECFSKLKKRFNTLFIPYALWNAVCIIILLLAGLIAPSMMSGENKPVLDWTVFDWLSAFWSTGGGKF